MKSESEQINGWCEKWKWTHRQLEGKWKWTHEKLKWKVTRPGCFCAKDCLDSVEMYK